MKPQRDVAINFHSTRKLMHKEVEECGQGYERDGEDGIPTQKLWERKSLHSKEKNSEWHQTSQR